MKNPFAWLTAFGLGAAGAHFLRVDLQIFGWIDGFGETAGRGMRAALAAGGVVVFMFAAARQHPKRGAPRGAAPTPERGSNPDADATRRHAGTARVQDRWPRLARRSAYTRSSTSSTAPTKSSRPGY
ncbi:MAG TPA: hypothetical protein VGA88_09425 [Burkholderiales bacterium]